MNAGPTSSRIYEVLRARLRQQVLPPGWRLDPATLAEELGASPTPVRDALHVLAGEDIVIAGAHGGFTIPLIDQPSLTDLYGWNGDVLTSALRQRRPPDRSAVGLDTLSGAETPLPLRISELFLHIANRSVNFEHQKMQARINDRLHSPRLIEFRVISNLEDEYLDMVESHLLDDLPNLRKKVLRHTKKRQNVAGRIIHTLYRGDFI